MDEFGNPIKWAKKGHSENGEDCSLCDLIKGGEKVNLNINMTSDGLNTKSSSKGEKGRQTPKVKSSSSKEGSGGLLRGLFKSK
jgi:hypothetical protein